MQHLWHSLYALMPFLGRHLVQHRSVPKRILVSASGCVAVGIALLSSVLSPEDLWAYNKGKMNVFSNLSTQISAYKGHCLFYPVSS